MPRKGVSPINSGDRLFCKLAYWDARQLYQHSARVDDLLDKSDGLRQVDARPACVRCRQARTRACASLDELLALRHPAERRLLLFRTVPDQNRKDHGNAVWKGLVA